LFRVAGFAIIGILTAVCGACSGDIGFPGGKQPLLVNPEPSGDWCDRIAPGPKGTKDPLLALAEAHAGVRFFAPEPGTMLEPKEDEPPRVSSCSKVDEAFSYAIRRQGTNPAALNPFAERLDTACALSAAEVVIPSLKIEMRGSSALVTPGQGDLQLPDHARMVIVDLRDTWSWPGLENELENLAGLSSARALKLCPYRVRKHQGLTDEVVSRDNVYENRIVELPGKEITPKAGSDLPLVFVIGARTAPEAARIAGCLRLIKRARLAGQPLISAVAESTWSPVGDMGLAYRVMDLLRPAGSGRWPDEIEPDFNANGMDELLDLLSKQDLEQEIGPVKSTETERPQVLGLDCFGDNDMEDLDCASLEAGLLSFWGTLELFYPYFERVSLDLNSLLPDLVARACSVNRSDRHQAAELIKAMGHSLQDGHFVVMSYKGGLRLQGTLPLYLEHPGPGVHIVRRSLADEVQPGDVIEAINEEPANEWYNRMLALTSASTPGFAYLQADTNLNYLSGPIALDVDRNGQTLRLYIDPYPFSALKELVHAPSDRPSGFLQDLGASDIMYINLAQELLSDQDTLLNLLSSAAPAAGLVLDLRGYPIIDHYDLAQRILDKDFKTPIYETPVLYGPVSRDVFRKQYDLSPLDDPSYHGPVTLLIGPSSFSAAENLALMLVQSGRVITVGRKTAGTNGNITGIQLPAGFSVTFTGMRVITASGQDFMGEGINPDIEVGLDRDDFVQGRDPELEAALASLK